MLTNYSLFRSFVKFEYPHQLHPYSYSRFYSLLLSVNRELCIVPSGATPQNIYPPPLSRWDVLDGHILRFLRPCGTTIVDPHDSAYIIHPLSVFFSVSIAKQQMILDMTDGFRNSLDRTKISPVISCISTIRRKAFKYKKKAKKHRVKEETKKEKYSYRIVTDGSTKKQVKTPREIYKLQPRIGKVYGRSKYFHRAKKQQ